MPEDETYFNPTPGVLLLDDVIWFLHDTRRTV
jgi:hypothetical protein